jgi:hypothetical protein
VNAVLAQGWRGATLPVVIGRHAVPRTRRAPEEQPMPEPNNKLRYFRETYPEAFERDVDLQGLLLDIGGPASEQIQRNALQRGRKDSLDRWQNLTPSEVWRLSMRDTFALLSAALRDPRRSLDWLRTHVLPRSDRGGSGTSSGAR